MIQWTEPCRLVNVEALDLENQVGHSFCRAQEAILMTIIDSISDGVIILDRKGTVLYLNREGAKILDLDVRYAVGRDVREVVDFQPVILEVLKTQKGYLEREFIIDSPKRGRLHFIKSAIVLLNRDREMIGVIDTFRRVDNVHKMIARITGAKAKFAFSDIIGEAPALQEALNLCKIAAQSAVNVLLEGESGTGKEMFAHAIHQASQRERGPFIIVNCAGLPLSLIESELFGYESGSFTGARKDGFAGKFEQANQGTIFLDEIGELPMDMQAKLLRVIQDKSFTRIGGKKEIIVNTRIIAATNKNLFEETKNHNFREDLYYRLNVLRIRIPSLRERPGDIPLLARHFVHKNAVQLGRPAPEIDAEVMNRLMTHPWPGNVRELENAIDRALILSLHERIRLEDLPHHLHEGNNGGNGIEASRDGKDQVSLEELERDEIRRTLSRCNGNLSHCSRVLGVSRNTLYRKIRRYAL